MNFDFSDENAKWLIIFSFIALFLFLCSIGNDIMEMVILLKIDEGIHVKLSEMDGSDFLDKILFFFIAGGMVAMFITYCIWIYGASKRVKNMDLQYLQFTPLRSFGYFFVPVLNMFKPLEALKEVYKAAQPVLRGNQKKEWIYNSSSSLLELCWMSLIIGTTLSLYSFIFLFDVYENLEYYFYKVLGIFATILQFVGVSALIYIVFKISNDLDKTEEAIEASKVEKPNDLVIAEY